MTGDALFQLRCCLTSENTGNVATWDHAFCIWSLQTALMSCAISGIVEHKGCAPSLSTRSVGFEDSDKGKGEHVWFSSRPVNGLRCPSTNTFIHALLSPLKGLRCFETQGLCSLLDVWDSLVLRLWVIVVFSADVMCWCHLSSHTIL